MNLAYQTEPWAQAREEIAALLPYHWAEIAGERDKIPLDPDWEFYATCDEKGMLHVVTVREDGALLVGYHITLVRPHPHYKSTLMGFTDVYYLAPPFRQGAAGITLFRTVEAGLRARGVRKLFTGTKLALDMGPLFQRLGWTETERQFTKYIGD